MRLRAEPAREAVRDALEDHHIVDGLLAEIDQLEPEDARYGEKMRGSRRASSATSKSEEDALFAQARIHLTDERLERLGRDMAILRESLGGDAVDPSSDAAPARASVRRAAGRWGWGWGGPGSAPRR